MDPTDVTPSEAAEVVLKERQRQREETRRKEARDNKGVETPEVRLEQVTTPRWEGVEIGEVDESELDRRQRALSERLERRQREVMQQGKRLAKVREELKELEQPIKTEIMQIRQKLEDANRVEISLVASVNALRKELVEKEKALTNVREEKQDHADELIRVMADYERRKTERLNEIAELVGDDVARSAKPPTTPAKSSFSGF